MFDLDHVLSASSVRLVYALDSGLGDYAAGVDVDADGVAALDGEPADDDVRAEQCQPVRVYGRPRRHLHGRPVFPPPRPARLRTIFSILPPSSPSSPL